MVSIIGGVGRALGQTVTSQFVTKKGQRAVSSFFGNFTPTSSYAYYSPPISGSRAGGRGGNIGSFGTEPLPGMDLSPFTAVPVKTGDAKLDTYFNRTNQQIVDGLNKVQSNFAIGFNYLYRQIQIQNATLNKDSRRLNTLLKNTNDLQDTVDRMNRRFQQQNQQQQRAQQQPQQQQQNQQQTQAVSKASILDIFGTLSGLKTAAEVTAALSLIGGIAYAIGSNPQARESVIEFFKQVGDPNSFVRRFMREPGKTTEAYVATGIKSFMKDTLGLSDDTIRMVGKVLRNIENSTLEFFASDLWKRATDNAKKFYWNLLTDPVKTIRDEITHDMATLDKIRDIAKTKTLEIVNEVEKTLKNEIDRDIVKIQKSIDDIWRFVKTPYDKTMELGQHIQREGEKANEARRKAWEDKDYKEAWENYYANEENEEAFRKDLLAKGGQVYKPQAGETYNSIAKKFGVSPGALLQANPYPTKQYRNSPSISTQKIYDTDVTSIGKREILIPPKPQSGFMDKLWKNIQENSKGFSFIAGAMADELPPELRGKTSSPASTIQQNLETESIKIDFFAHDTLKLRGNNLELDFVDIKMTPATEAAMRRILSGYTPKDVAPYGSITRVPGIGPPIGHFSSAYKTQSTGSFSGAMATPSIRSGSMMSGGIGGSYGTGLSGGLDVDPSLFSIQRNPIRSIRRSTGGYGQNVPKPGSQTASQEQVMQAVDDMFRIQGKHETYDHDVVKQYLASGGVGLDPETQAWCAGAVNAALAHAGVQGTGSQLARSFAGWGAEVDRSQGFKKGDVFLFPPHGGSTGHVGMIFDPNPDKEGKIGIIAGNTGDRMTPYRVFPSQAINIRRALAPPLSGGGAPPPAGGSTNAFLANRRQRLFGTELKDPEVQDEVMRAARAENHGETTGVMEILMNGADATGRTLRQQLHSGFYGPINRNQSSFTDPLTPGQKKQFGARLEETLRGADATDKRTDQGMYDPSRGINEHKDDTGQTQPRLTQIQGEWYSDKYPNWTARMNAEEAAFNKGNLAPGPGNDPWANAKPSNGQDLPSGGYGDNPFDKDIRDQYNYSAFDKDRMAGISPNKPVPTTEKGTPPEGWTIGKYTSDFESHGPTPGSDGYGSRKASADGGGICAI